MSQLQLNTINTPHKATQFADIILPVPIPKSFTYRVPKELEGQLMIGSRVIIPFGKRKVLTGIVEQIHQKPPQNYEARYVLDVMDHSPIMHPVQIKLMQWIAEYYMCTVGEVLNSALPSGLKLNSESKIQLHPQYSTNESSSLSNKEEIVLSALKQQETLDYNEINELLGIKTIYPIIKSLIKREAIILFEQINEKYKPKTETRFRFTNHYIENEEQLEILFQQLEKYPKQTDILLKYLQKVPVYEDKTSNTVGYPKKCIKQENLSSSSLNTLIKKGVFELFDKEVSRFSDTPITNPDPIILSKDQIIAKNEIHATFSENKPALLHGITGSGKTEIYIQLIQEALEAGNQVLYLLPEIALTTQIVTRLRKVFGSNMGVYHSKFSDNERVEVWNGVLSDKFSFVVGVRSSIFLPFDNLGLVIIDEEHENSYKQYDPAPRYNARDVAIYLAKQHYAQVLLGSATPSLESYYNAKTGKYTLIELNTRYANAQLPAVKTVDVLREKKRKTIKNDFTSELIEAIQQRLKNKEQSIIFQNRRGYSPYINCDTCGWIPKCEQCAVSLTYHLYKHELRCHYCGHKTVVPTHCGACESTKITTVGFGTEKLEEDLQLMLPDAKIQRMDLDTTRNKYSYQRIIDAFEKGDIDILVGTQMVTKGLDFDKVSLVGVLDADRMLHFPDFRSGERTFQLITQVSGRAGRRKQQGEVIIQTNDPEQPIFKWIANHDYDSFYNKEIEERKNYQYPPFNRLVALTIKNKDKGLCSETATKLYNLLVENLGRAGVLGPEEPAINKIRNQYLMKVFIKLDYKHISLSKAKQLIQSKVDLLFTDRKVKSSRVVIDVDPY